MMRNEIQLDKLPSDFEISPEAYDLVIALTKSIALQIEYGNLTRRLSTRLLEVEPDKEKLTDPALVRAAMAETNLFLERSGF